MKANTYFRYLGHAILMSSIILIMYIIIATGDGGSIGNTRIYTFAGLIFSIMFAIYYSNIASNYRITIIYDEDIEKKLDEIIINRLKRSNIVTKSGEKVYYMKNRYYAWLTNEVIIKKEQDKLFLDIPKQYIKDVKEIIGSKNLLSIEPLE